MEPEDVRNELETYFPGAIGCFDRDSGSGKIVGDLVWDQFDNVEFLERQRRVFMRLREVFGLDAQQISLIFTYTPDEYHDLAAA